MADMLVDSTKLDACLDAEADAIRAKTGGSADIPFDFANNKGFADAIASIQTGGTLSEIATVGANTVSNMTNAETYLKGLATIDLSSNKYVIQIETGYESPSNNQVGSIIRYDTDHIGKFTAGKRYRSGGWNPVEMGSIYDAILVEGTSYKITVLG